MVVSIVMAIFFQEQPEPGELAGTLSIYRRPAASMVSAAFGACA
jgi:hypothetical protein